MKGILRQIKFNIINRKGALDKPIIDLSSECANTLIIESLSKKEAVMIARFGAFEIGVAKSVYTPITIQNIIRFFNGEISSIGYNRKLVDYFCNNAGFFPNSKNLITKYARLLLDDMQQCDILGSWQPAEKFFSEQLKSCEKIAVKDLEPFHHADPWTKVLAGKKVLVIHPYEESIRHQWEIRDKLFPTRDFLPEFDLQIIKAVQSIAGTKSEFDTWFDALDYMKAEIDKRDFDIALIGCGAYGFHLAAHVKRIGKNAVHLGGVLQILFGIMGKRWEGKYPFVNEHWIRPLPSDMVQNAKSIENGCYW